MVGIGGSARSRSGALATNFSAVDPASNGNVTMFLQGSSIPGAAGNFTEVPPSNSTGLSKRGLFSWIGNTLKSENPYIIQFNVPCHIYTYLADLSDFNKNITGSSPLDFEKDVNLFDQSIDCPQSGAIPGFKGEVKVDISPKVHGNVNYGIAAAGTIVPPNIDEFGLFVNLDTTVTGTLTLGATLEVSISLSS